MLLGRCCAALQRCSTQTDFLQTLRHPVSKSRWMREVCVPVHMLSLLSYTSLQGIDRDLTDACEDLISRCADAASQPVRTFIDRCAVFRASRESAISDTSPTSFSLPKQDFATPTNVMQVDKDFRASCNKEMTAWLARLQIYLEDSKTVSILVAPLKAKVVQSYGSFRDLVGTEFPHELVDDLPSPMDFWSFVDRLCTEHNAP
jgi:conserved oligomeric Golgi complex subunit 3